MAPMRRDEDGDIGGVYEEREVRYYVRAKY